MNLLTVVKQPKLVRWWGNRSDQYYSSTNRTVS